MSDIPISPGEIEKATQHDVTTLLVKLDDTPISDRYSSFQDHKFAELFSSFEGGFDKVFKYLQTQNLVGRTEMFGEEIIPIRFEGPNLIERPLKHRLIDIHDWWFPEVKLGADRFGLNKSQIKVCTPEAEQEVKERLEQLSSKATSAHFRSSAQKKREEIQKFEDDLHEGIWMIFDYFLVLRDSSMASTVCRFFSGMIRHAILACYYPSDPSEWPVGWIPLGSNDPADDAGWLKRFFSMRSTYACELVHKDTPEESVRVFIDGRHTSLVDEILARQRPLCNTVSNWENCLLPQLLFKTLRSQLTTKMDFRAEHWSLL